MFDRLAQSKFRSGFYLKEKDKAYAADKGREKIEKHAQDFIRMRLAPAVIPNDGKQTPMKGHPVFLAQHACACCCRGCLEKWHGIPKGRELTGEEQEYVVDVLMTWIDRQMEGYRPSKSLASASGKKAKEPDYEQHFDVKEAFARLEEEERMILSYSVFAGYGSEEIAQVLEMNAATVRSKKSRALGKMRKMLEAG